VGLVGCSFSELVCFGSQPAPYHVRLVRPPRLSIDAYQMNKAVYLSYEMTFYTIRGEKFFIKITDERARENGRIAKKRNVLEGQEKETLSKSHVSTLFLSALSLPLDAYRHIGQQRLWIGYITSLSILLIGGRSRMEGGLATVAS